MKYSVSICKEYEGAVISMTFVDYYFEQRPFHVLLDLVPHLVVPNFRSEREIDEWVYIT
jgi:hypothetical protein